MELIVYVFISESKVKSYLYLRHLTEDNPEVPYFKTWRVLKTKTSVVTDTYKIYVNSIKWKTKRGFYKQHDEYE